MWNFIKSKKWYIVHGAFMVAGFLDPAVTAYAAGHKGAAGVVLVAWGWLLHYLDGKDKAARPVLGQG